MTRDTEFPPSGCAVCGRRERNHGMVSYRGIHTYQAPSADVIKARMRATK